jgi:hypothetical protein
MTLAEATDILLGGLTSTLASDETDAARSEISIDPRGTIQRRLDQKLQDDSTTQRHHR